VGRGGERGNGRGKGGKEGEWENCAPYLQILATPLVPAPLRGSFSEAP